MELRRTRLSQGFREAREELLNFNFATDKPVRPLPPNMSRPYGLVYIWFEKWNPTFTKFYTFTQGGMNVLYQINESLHGYEGDGEYEVFNEIRPELVAIIDTALRRLDQEYLVKPVLDDYIRRVKDTKLSELLKEFNASKGSSPNLIAMGFRTILSLIIREKAKRVNPTSKTATRTDLAPQSMINSARNKQILSKDEQRLVDSFVSTHKDIYDFVTHRPTILTDKSEVDTMVDLLNKLLPSIIN